MTISLLALALAAPVFGDPADFESHNLLSWPDTPAFNPATFQRVETGEFLADEEVQALVLSNNRLFLMRQPNVFESFIRMEMSGINVTDMAARNKGPVDKAILTTPNGLFEATLLDDATDMTIAGISLAANWHSAKVWVDAAGSSKEVLGISADGTKILRANDSTGSWLQAPPIVMPAAHTALAVVAGNFDPAAGREIAVLTDLTLDFYNLAGTLLKSWANTSGGGLIEVFPRLDLPGRDYVAFALNPSGGSQWVFFGIDTLGREDTVLLNFSPDGVAPAVQIDPTGMSAGDLDNDGDIDLLIQHKTHSTVIGLLNDYSSSHFSLASAETWAIAPDPTVAAPNSTSSPAVLKFHSDLDSGAIVASEDQDAIYIIPMLYTEADGGNELPTIGLIAGMNMAFNAPDDDLGGQSDAVDVIVNLEPQGDPPLYPYIMVRTFAQTDPWTDPTSLLDADLVNGVARLHPIENAIGGGLHKFRVYLPDMSGTFWSDHQHYYFQIRLINADDTDGDGNWTPTAASSQRGRTGMTLFYDAIESPDYSQYMENDLPTATGGIQSVIIPPPPPGDGTTGGSGIVVGGFVTVDRIPAFQTGGPRGGSLIESTTATFINP